MIFTWCPHLISYGLHIIPRAEGRNDVFSPIFAHWPTAPRRMSTTLPVLSLHIACSVKPNTFQTQFIIDTFHQKNYTKCSPACFLSSYKKHDAEWRNLNGSACECGNRGLDRIKKTVSYSKQSTALLLASKYLDIWNRLRLPDWEIVIQV